VTIFAVTNSVLLRSRRGSFSKFYTEAARD
jgi:hypothetical protein